MSCSSTWWQSSSGSAPRLVVGLFPITKNLKPLFLAIAGGAYVVWTAAYFVAFWSITGQTLGSRVMQVRLVTASGEKIKPVRAFLRWIGMSLAMIPLPWGYVPIPFKRLGFPDWLADTRVIEAEQLSIAVARRERSRDARDDSDKQLPPSRRKPAIFHADQTSLRRRARRDPSAAASVVR